VKCPCTPPVLGLDGFPLFSLRDVNRLPIEQRETLYRELVPSRVFHLLELDPEAPGGCDAFNRLRFLCPEGLGLLRIEGRRHPGDRDCLFFAEIADTPYGQIELAFCLINDPDSPRFDIDQDQMGRDNLFGTLRRNIPEEIRAMEAGLSPNQVRRGLRLFSEFFTRLERFVASLGIDTIVAEPLSYANAIRYENYGFDYIAGKQLMLWIDREFQSDGELFRRLDGSSPFRRPGMEKTVRGRSWAIQDAIMGRPWDGVRIYKVIGVDAGIDTFPGRRF
jgi:hypothetical protein